MKIIQINTVFNQGSTGKIAFDIQNSCKNKGFENTVAYRYAEKRKKYDNIYEISTWLDCHVHNRLARITSFQGRFSKLRTEKFIKYLNAYKPDIVHLHNIHGSYINHMLLFTYIKKNNVKVIWTLHDCWAFTGNCTYFDIVNCDKWKTGCYDCPLYGQHPESYKNRTRTMYLLKKKWFIGIKDLTIVTPSKWLADLVKQSFLKEYPIKVINNGINLDVFKPVESNFREKYNCKDKFVLLGVAFDWGKRKGLDVFVDLAQRLDVSKYQIVLVGTDDTIDRLLPENIISIHRTQNQRELAEIYSAADIFANPTREEVLGLVNIEALACGTPVVTFKTGGSPECIDDTCGSVVSCDDIDAFCLEVVRCCKTKPFTVEACLKRARDFDMNTKYMEYIGLYEDIVAGTEK